MEMSDKKYKIKKWYKLVCGVLVVVVSSHVLDKFSVYSSVRSIFIIILFKFAQRVNLRILLLLLLLLLTLKYWARNVMKG